MTATLNSYQTHSSSACFQRIKTGIVVSSLIAPRITSLTGSRSSACIPRWRADFGGIIELWHPVSATMDILIDWSLDESRMGNPNDAWSFGSSVTRTNSIGWGLEGRAIHFPSNTWWPVQQHCSWTAGQKCHCLAPMWYTTGHRHNQHYRVLYPLMYVPKVGSCGLYCADKLSMKHRGGPKYHTQNTCCMTLCSVL